LIGLLVTTSCGDNVHLASDKAITAFSIDGVAGTINGTSIAVMLPHGTDKTNLTPTITFTGESVSPESGTPQDFTSPVVYTVHAADHTTVAYTATVSVAPSDAKAITELSFEDASNAALAADVVATISGTTITATVPFGTDVSALVATYTTTGIAVTVGSSTQMSGVTANNFASPVLYTAHAADGSVQVYTVTVIVALDQAKDITAYSFESANNAGLPADVTAVISATSITATVPFGTNVSDLVATFSTSGTGVKVGTTAQVSGTTPNDFTSPVTYTVTAADNTTKVYTVTVTVAPSAAKDLGPYQFFTVNNPALSVDVTASISGTQITAIVPFGANITNLIATFTTTGASVSVGTTVQVSGQTANDFTNPVTYTVTAADGSTQDYTVTVINSLSADKDILQFTVLNVDGIVNGTAIALTVPFGTDVTALIPTIVINGKSVNPVSGVPQDFTSPVQYTVTAADNTTKVYTVTVTIAGNSDKDITRFTVNGLDASISTTSPTTGIIALNVPTGSSLTNLSPVVTITGVSVTPASGVAQDFTNPVDYVVKAADGTTKTYTVTIGTVNGNGTKLISSFTILGVSGSITNGQQSATVTVVLPAGTNLDGQTPTIVINASSISPPSRVPQNFPNPVIYTVKAADGSTRVYTVTVTTN
jgi:hypothetical protein